MNIDTNKASTGPAKKEKINFTSYVEKEDVPCRIHLTKGYHFRPRQSREFRSALHPSLPLELSVPQLDFRKHPAIILRHLVRQQLKKKKVPEKQRHLMTLRGEQASKLRLFSNSQEECFGLHSWAPVKMLETSLLIVNAFCCCEIEMIVFQGLSFMRIRNIRFRPSWQCTSVGEELRSSRTREGRALYYQNQYA